MSTMNNSYASTKIELHGVILWRYYSRTNLPTNVMEDYFHPTLDHVLVLSLTFSSLHLCLVAPIMMCSSLLFVLNTQSVKR